MIAPIQSEPLSARGGNRRYSQKGEATPVFGRSPPLESEQSAHSPDDPRSIQYNTEFLVILYQKTHKTKSLWKTYLFSVLCLSTYHSTVSRHSSINGGIHYGISSSSSAPRFPSTLLNNSIISIAMTVLLFIALRSLAIFTTSHIRCALSFSHSHLQQTQSFVESLDK